MQTLPNASASNYLAADSWLPFNCPNCGLRRLAIQPTTDGFLTAGNCSIVCQICSIESDLQEIAALFPAVQGWLPDGDVDSSKCGRGREANITFGKGFGATGRIRSEQFRYAIDMANGWNWNRKTPNGSAERDRLYAIKSTVGVFEDKSMKSALEMVSRKIKRVEARRHLKIPEPVVDELAKLIRKGVRSAEARRPTTSRDRKLIVETIMETMGLWPQ